MKSSTTLTLLLLSVAIMFLGCSRTVTGGYEDSPDGKYRIWVRTFGAYGHAFTDYTRKTIRISIVEVIGAKSMSEKEDLGVFGSMTAK